MSFGDLDTLAGIIGASLAVSARIIVDIVKGSDRRQVYVRGKVVVAAVTTAIVLFFLGRTSAVPSDRLDKLDRLLVLAVESMG